MKLLISGSRSILQFDLTPHVPLQTELIIIGGANGIDRIAEEFADRHKISKLVLRPAYRRFGKGAPLRRNQQMVDIADEVLVIWDDSSRGSKHTLDYAKKQGKPVTVIRPTPIG